MKKLIAASPLMKTAPETYSMQTLKCSLITAPPPVDPTLFAEPTGLPVGAEDRFWNALGRCPHAVGVMADWRGAARATLPWLRPFLAPTAVVAETLPCPAEPPCGCRHEIIQLDNECLAVCVCAERDCPPATVAAGDLVVYQLDGAALGAALCAALSLQVCPGGVATEVPGGGPLWRVGVYPPLLAPVFLSTRANAPAWQACVRATGDKPFLFLAAAVAPGFEPPTGTGLLLPLALCLRMIRPGVFAAAASVAVILSDWVNRVVRGEDLSRTLHDIHREIAGVRTEFVALKTARDQLQQMQAAGLLEFVRRIDLDSFRQLAAILCEGDVAKASRALGMKDATLRSALSTWRSRGPAYTAMLDLVRWRKKTSGRAKVPFNENLWHQRTETADFPGVLSDVLDGLLAMNEGNWEEHCEELKELLRTAVAPTRG